MNVSSRLGGESGIQMGPGIRGVPGTGVQLFDAQSHQTNPVGRHTSDTETSPFQAGSRTKRVISRTPGRKFTQGLRFGAYRLAWRHCFVAFLGVSGGFKPEGRRPRKARMWKRDLTVFIWTRPPSWMQPFFLNWRRFPAPEKRPAPYPAPAPVTGGRLSADASPRPPPLKKPPRDAAGKYPLKRADNKGMKRLAFRSQRRACSENLITAPRVRSPALGAFTFIKRRAPTLRPHQLPLVCFGIGCIF